MILGEVDGIIVKFIFICSLQTQKQICNEVLRSVLTPPIAQARQVKQANPKKKIVALSHWAWAI